MEFDPIAFEVDDSGFTFSYCEDCAPEGAKPIISWAWSDLASAPPHGVLCNGCDTQLMLGWCGSQDGNEGNGFCDDCRFDASDSMEDNYENLGS